MCVCGCVWVCACVCTQNSLDQSVAKFCTLHILLLLSLHRGSVFHCQLFACVVIQQSLTKPEVESRVQCKSTAQQCMLYQSCVTLQCILYQSCVTLQCILYQSCVTLQCILYQSCVTLQWVLWIQALKVASAEKPDGDGDEGAKW